MIRNAKDCCRRCFPFVAAVTALLTAWLQGGCKRERPLESAGRAEWSWARYAVAKDLTVTQVEACVRAEASVRFHAPGNGRLSFTKPRPVNRLEEGELWAVFSPESLKLAEEMLAARREALALRREVFTGVELPQRRLEVEKQLRESTRLREMTRRLAADEGKWEALRALVPPLAAESREDAPALLDRTVGVLKRQLALLDEQGSVAVSPELRIAEVELRQAEIDLELRRSQYELRMPFDGEILCNLDMQEGCTEYAVNSGQLLGIARRVDSLVCEVRMQDSRWLGLAPEMLFLRLQLPGGSKVQLPFVARRVREEARAEVLYYAFAAGPKEVEILRRSIDSVVDAELCLRLESVVRIVPKADLLRLAPETFGHGNWSDGVRERWPGVQLLGEGGAHVGVAGGEAGP